MLILLLFIVAVIGLVVVLVVNFQSSGRGGRCTVTSPGGAQDVNVIPSLSPSMTPAPLPTQQLVVSTLLPALEFSNAPTGRPTVQNTPTSIANNKSY
jgi:hypothetical protein